MTSWFAGKKTEEEPETRKTVKVEKLVNRRVLKRRKMSRRHGSEAFEPEKVSTKEMEITRQVLDNIGAAPAPTNAAPPQPDESGAVETFACIQCGARVPVGASACPKCDCHYLNDISEEQLRDLESAEREIREEAFPEASRMIGRTDAPCIHFDAQDGRISYLKEDHELPNVSVVCSSCDTEIEFDTDRCPICGSKLDKTETGLVGLFEGMEFDNDESNEMDCPFCGEHVVLVNGTCPECKEAVGSDDAESPSERIDPVIHMDNVVFLHLDVSTGEVNFLQKLTRNRGFEQVTVQLEGIGSSGFDKDWKSLSRV